VQTTSLVKDSVFSLPLDLMGLIERFKVSAVNQGFRVEIFGQQGHFPLIALTKRSTGLKPRIYLSAGIHGDEPAPPLTLLRLLESGFFGSQATWFICPVLNPEGLKLGTRESPSKADLNRAFKLPIEPETQAHVHWLKRQPNFNLTLCVHEDWEAKGFYLYELNPNNKPSLADIMLCAAKDYSPIDLSPLIDGREANQGIIHTDPNPANRDLWPESIYLIAKHYAGLHYTLETASGFPLTQRLNTMVAVIRAAISSLK